MNKTPVYISFDYDNDKELKDFIIGQSKNERSPFAVIDHSIKHAVDGDWVRNAEVRIKKSKVVLVMVGRKTYSAQGVKKEVELGRKHGKKIAQIIGYNDSRPPRVENAGNMYIWSWDNLRKILNDV